MYLLYFIMNYRVYRSFATDSSEIGRKYSTKRRTKLRCTLTICRPNQTSLNYNKKLQNRRSFSKTATREVETATVIGYTVYRRMITELRLAQPTGFRFNRMQLQHRGTALYGTGLLLRPA